VGGASADGGERLQSFPEEIVRFLYEHVESIDQLEILRVLGEDPGRDWDAVALAGTIQAEPPTVRAHLVAMHARGLLAMTGREGGHTFRHGARTPELEDKLRRLLLLYKERPVTMIKIVYQQARDPLRAFADAFQIRKGV
jgi:hypothetical protein